MSQISQFDRVCFQNLIVKDHANFNATTEFRKEMRIKGPVSSGDRTQPIQICSELVVKESINLEKGINIKGDLCVEGKLIEKDVFDERNKAFENMRYLCPDEPCKLGTSSAKQAAEYCNMPFQAGGTFGNGLKIEYDSGANKYTLPGLSVDTTFDLVPSSDESGVFESEILDVGFDQPPFYWPRYLAQHWYGVSQNEENFYYSVHGGSLFGALFGYGTSSLLVCRRRSDASLVWCKSIWNYSLDIPKQPLYIGTYTRIARITLANHKNRLYITTLFTNIGPQLHCIDATNGSPIWTMAYELPAAAQIALATDHIVSPSTPLGSFDGSVYAGAGVAIGDLNIVCADLVPGAVSVFVGVSSYQNAVNPASFVGFPVSTDQGKLIRVDDLGSTATRVWECNTCGRKIQVGDTISNAGPDDLNPFRPGTSKTLIWRDTTVTGTFADGGVIGQVMDYNTPGAWPNYVPGYKPVGWPSLNNNTMPIVTNVLLFGGAPPLTESSVQNVWRSPAPGIGAAMRIYQDDFSPPDTITNRLISWNAIQAGLSPGDLVKIVIWAYLSQIEVNAVDGAAWGASNAGVRYAACLPSPYVITNVQEANELGYYGNSVWGNSPTINIDKGLVFFGSGQAHACPLDEELYYQAPGIEYIDRKQAVLDTMYEYARLDTSTLAAPISTLSDVISAKNMFTDTNITLASNYTDRSPRGNQAYSDGMFAADLETGDMVFGTRVVPWDTETFVSSNPSDIVFESVALDADVASGIQYYDNVSTPLGYKTLLAAVNKGALCTILDISGLNPNVTFNHQNLSDKGVVVSQLYVGPDGALGGSNFAHSQEGGHKLIFCSANNASFGTSQSSTYNTGYYQGFEFHVANDGRVFKPKNSYISCIDISEKKINWETDVGDVSHSTTAVYNGVVTFSHGPGILYQLDVATGKPIWKLDVSPYEMGGINSASFSNGRAVWISNYALPFGGANTKNGSTGLLLSVDKDKLVLPTDDLSLLGNKVFESFDIFPKKEPGSISPFAPLLDVQSISHCWSSDGTMLMATHTYETVDTVLNLTVKKFMPGTQSIVFDKFANDSGIRYISMTMLNRETYQLEYQLYQSGVWNNYHATLSVNLLLAKAKKSFELSKIESNTNHLSHKAKFLYNQLQKKQNL